MRPKDRQMPKRFMMRATLMLLACVAGTTPTRGAPGPFEVANGSYRVVTPAGWDGSRKLPLVLYIHGYGQSSADVIDDRALVEAVTDSGAVLVVPDGLNRTWSFAGSPSQGARDEIAFLRAVLADAERRWPIDQSRVIAAGFSIGGSVVWDLACHAAEGFAAFLPVSGDFWLPYPQGCGSGPANLRHIHGINDQTVPMGGRPLRGGRFIQGDIGKSLAILQQTDRCGAEADRIEQQGEFKCWIWSSCASGKRLELCLHGDGHVMNAQWLRDGIAWAFRLPAASGG
jgi:polyhydroxybutyrate depolymerase